MEVTVTKSPRSRPDWKVITSLYVEGFRPVAISAKTGISADTIRVGLCKRGVTKTKREAVVYDYGEDLSRATRTKLKIAVCAESIVDQLNIKTPTSADGLNRHADTLAKITKTAALVYAWGENPAIAVIVAGDIGGRANPEDMEPARAVDIESVDGSERHNDAW